MTARLREESGQALVLTLVFLTLIVGATGLTVDVGSWYRESRQAQSTADASALSGAQQLQQGTGPALATAQTYGTQNGGGIDPNGITFRSDFNPNDTVVVKVTRTAPGFFATLFGVDSVQVHATAAARSAVPLDVRWAAPIVVQKDHPMLSGPGCPCFGPANETAIPLGKNGAPGSFGIVDLQKFTQAANDGTCSSSTGGGNAGASTVGSWIQSGFSDYLNLGCYSSDPGAKFNSSNVEDALTARLNTTLLFPVYDTLTGNGANAQYHIIGWAAYYVTGWATNSGSMGGCTSPSGSGTSAAVCGYFTQVIWDGIQSSTAPTDPDFGVHTIALVN